MNILALPHNGGHPVLWVQEVSNGDPENTRRLAVVNHVNRRRRRPPTQHRRHHVVAHRQRKAGECTQDLNPGRIQPRLLARLTKRSINWACVSGVYTAPRERHLPGM